MTLVGAHGNDHHDGEITDNKSNGDNDNCNTATTTTNEDNNSLLEIPSLFSPIQTAILNLVPTYETGTSTTSPPKLSPLLVSLRSVEERVHK